jgi:hypothetical protein
VVFDDTEPVADRQEGLPARCELVVVGEYVESGHIPWPEDSLISRAIEEAFVVPAGLSDRSTEFLARRRAASKPGLRGCTVTHSSPRDVQLPQRGCPSSHLTLRFRHCVQAKERRCLFAPRGMPAFAFMFRRNGYYGGQIGTYEHSRLEVVQVR